MKNGRKLSLAIVVAIAAAFVSPSAKATSATGTVAVTATTVSSVSLTFQSDGAGIVLGGTGTSAATVAFGSVQAYGGAVPAGVTKTVNAPTNWSLSTPIDVVVQVANQPSSANYTLTAALQTADATNTWFLGATGLTTTAAQLTNTGGYGSTPYTFKLTIPFSEAAGTISNTINFTATAN
jgi:hypothetical protein